MTDENFLASPKMAGERSFQLVRSRDVYSVASSSQFLRWSTPRVLLYSRVVQVSGSGKKAEWKAAHGERGTLCRCPVCHQLEGVAQLLLLLFPY